MTYEEFVQIFNFSGMDFLKSRAIVIFNPPCDSNIFLDYFIENVDNLTDMHHLFVDNRVYIIVNNDIVFKDTLASYIDVDPPIIKIVEDEGTV